jgi:hypothetical protein
MIIRSLLLAESLGTGREVTCPEEENGAARKVTFDIYILR